MPAARTEITEITTGLGMLGFESLDRALEVRPRSVFNVTGAHYDRLEAARDGGDFAREFQVAWRNGVAFASSSEGLRGRPPWSLEWKGSHRPPGYEQLPADLRVDHVYLISCKYGSNILTNSSPANLFDRLLGERGDAGPDWFLDVAPEAYQAFYDACRRHLGGTALPDRVEDLGQDDRETLKRGVPRHLSGELGGIYRAFAREVAAASALRWTAQMGRPSRQEESLWRLLRLQAAPYFVLGESAEGSPLCYRIGTPWDFRNRYRFVGLEASSDATRRQPVVQWCAEVHDRESGTAVTVRGHVEVRWSHGRFAQAPEAKVYLGTAHHLVPGYVPLTGPPQPGRLQLQWEEPGP